MRTRGRRRKLEDDVKEQGSDERDDMVSCESGKKARRRRQGAAVE